MKIICDKVRGLRVLSLVVVDAVFINTAVLLSLIIRFEFSMQSLVESGFAENYFVMAPVYTIAAIGVFTLLRLYRSLWAYASIDEIRNICGAVLVTSGLL